MPMYMRVKNKILEPCSYPAAAPQPKPKQGKEVCSAHVRTRLAVDSDDGLRSFLKQPSPDISRDAKALGYSRDMNYPLQKFCIFQIGRQSIRQQIPMRAPPGLHRPGRPSFHFKNAFCPKDSGQLSASCSRRIAGSTHR